MEPFCMIGRKHGRSARDDQPEPHMKQLLLLILLVIAPGLIVAQTGTEFWVAPPDVTFLHNQPGDEPIYFNVTAGNTAATVTIAQPANAGFNGGTPIVLNVPANSSVRYNMTSLKAQLETRPTNTICNTGLPCCRCERDRRIGAPEEAGSGHQPLDIGSPNSELAAPTAALAPVLKAASGLRRWHVWIVWVVAVVLAVALLTFLGSRDGDSS